MKKEDIIDLQNYIKSKGLEEDALVNDVMHQNSNEIDEYLDYFKSIAGKCFKKVLNGCIYYSYIHPNITSTTAFGFKEKVVAFEDRYEFCAYDGFIQLSKELNHCIYNTENTHRYDKYTMISKEAFDKEMKFLSALAEHSKDVLKQLSENE